MIAELNALMSGVNRASDANNLLRKVQEIVFGTSDLSKRDWNTKHRIDNFEFSPDGVSLSVGDGALRATYRFNIPFEKQQRLRSVA